MLFQEHQASTKFEQWIREDRENKLLLWISVLATLFLFIGFKSRYTLPNFMGSDSDSYMYAAFTNQPINLYPIGYSKFLRLISCFTHSSLVIVLLQYFLLQASLFYLLFSIRYLFSPGRWLFRFMLACSILNPLLLHISNLISSDAIFTALSIIWFTQLLWLLYNPNRRLLLFHIIVLFLAFIFRYNALYFPVISIFVTTFSILQTKTKLLGICLIIGILATLVTRTIYQYKNITDTTQYSALEGWQLASNALYGYTHAPSDMTEKVPDRFKKINEFVNRHMLFLQNVTPYFIRSNFNLGNYYLSDPNSPLKMYMEDRWKNDSVTEYFKRWSIMGSLYSDYGRYLIRKRPDLYIKYFLWPNLRKYYVPAVGSLSTYNNGQDTISNTAKVWFSLINSKISIPNRNKIITIFSYFPMLMAFTNLLFILGLIAFASIGGFKQIPHHIQRILKCTLVVWVTNMVFSVFAAPIELRQQIFPMTITFCFVLILTENIVRQSLNESNKTLFKQIIKTT